MSTVITLNGTQYTVPDAFEGNAYAAVWEAFFSDVAEHVAGLVAGTLSASDIYAAQNRSSAVDVTLTAASPRVQRVSMTASGKAVTMPDATTLVAGQPWIVKNAATEAFAVKDGGGTAIAAAVAADATFVLLPWNIATAAGQWISWTAGEATTVDQTARTNIMLNAFRIAVNGGLSIMNMVDGVVDEFEDETGVDTATSTDETYDATDDYYHNPGGTGPNCLTGGSGHTSTALFSGSASLLFDGSTATELRFGDTTTDYAYLQLAGGTAKTITSFRFRTGSSDVATKFTGWDVYGSNDGSSWSSLLGSGVISVGASTDTWYGPFSISSPGSYSYYKFEMRTGGQNSNAFQCEIEAFETLTSANMVLVSEIAVAETAPDEAFLVVWQEDVDTVTINTDLIAEVSRDDGSNWSTVTLTEESTLASGRILAGSVDISGQPSDTDMLWRLTIANNKEQRIHGVGLEWS
jgi:hypothetical protein